jgi:hypothetical protein
MAGLSIKAQLGYKRTVVFALSVPSGRGPKGATQYLRLLRWLFPPKFNIWRSVDLVQARSRYLMNLKGTGDEVLHGSPDVSSPCFC